MALNILLVIKKAKILNRYVSSYLKWLDTENILKTKEKKKDKCNDDVCDKCNEIWDKIKIILNIKFHSMPVYDEKYIKVKVREFNSAIKTNFLGD